VRGLSHKHQRFLIKFLSSRRGRSINRYHNVGQTPVLLSTFAKEVLMDSILDVNLRKNGVERVSEGPTEEWDIGESRVSIDFPGIGNDY
jgi:hypothetical protein